MKALICGGDFSLRVIRRLIHTINESRKVRSECVKIMHITDKERRQIFTLKPESGITTGRRKIHYNPLVKGFTEIA